MKHRLLTNTPIDVFANNLAGRNQNNRKMFENVWFEAIKTHKKESD